MEAAVSSSEAACSVEACDSSSEEDAIYCAAALTCTEPSFKD